MNETEIARSSAGPHIFNEANARLIAAAPSLLAELKRAVQYLDHPDVQAMPFAVRAEVAAKRAHDAIEAAEGNA